MSKQNKPDNQNTKVITSQDPSLNDNSFETALKHVDMIADSLSKIMILQKNNMDINDLKTDLKKQLINQLQKNSADEASK